MRAFLICNHGNDFWPVEEIIDEGGLQQSIEAHVDNFNEEHREYIRVFFPEMPTETLNENQRRRLRIEAERAEVEEAGLSEILAKEILDLYDNTNR